MSEDVPSLSGRTARAAQWRFAASAVAALSQFGIGILLARLLPPADFGLVALAFIVVGLVRPVGDLGIGDAVVQRADLTARHVRTGFTFASVFGGALAAALMALAPLGAWAVRDPRVTPLIRLLALAFALQGVAVVARALLRRRLDFRRLFVIDTITYILGYGAVAVAMALLGYGVWSLVWGGLTQSVLASLALLLAVRHSVTPLLAKKELTDLLDFGVGSSLNLSVNYVALNADNFVVGRWLGAGSLGLYNRAYSLMTLPHTYAASVMTGVLFPAFSEVQADTARLRRAYLAVTRLTAVITASAMATMAIAAPYLVRGLYGPRWIGVVPPLQILCLAGYFRALYHLGGVVAQSVGMVYRELWRQAIYALLVIVGALVGTRFGLQGVAVGVGIAILYMFVATGQLALQITGTAWLTYLRVQAGALVLAFITGSVALAARFFVQGTNAGSITKAAAILAAAAIPWTLGLAWNLAHPELDGLRSTLPPGCARVIEKLGGPGRFRGGAERIGVAQGPRN